MKVIVFALALASVVPTLAPAQPLEQNFAFGAPLGVLGNDRFRRGPVGMRPTPPRTRSGDVAVRLGLRPPVARERRWN